MKLTDPHSTLHQLDSNNPWYVDNHNTIEAYLELSLKGDGKYLKMKMKIFY